MLVDSRLFCLMATGRDAARFKGQPPVFSVFISCRMWDERCFGGVIMSEFEEFSEASYAYCLRTETRETE